jgi:hypothetical protein
MSLWMRLRMCFSLFGGAANVLTGIGKNWRLPDFATAGALANSRGTTVFCGEANPRALPGAIDS